MCVLIPCCYCSVTKLYLTLCNPIDYNPPGSPVHGVFEARIVEYVAPFPSPRYLPDPGIELMSPALACRFFTTEPTEKLCINSLCWCNKLPQTSSLRTIQIYDFKCLEVWSQESKHKQGCIHVKGFKGGSIFLIFFVFQFCLHF